MKTLLSTILATLVIVSTSFAAPPATTSTPPPGGTLAPGPVGGQMSPGPVGGAITSGGFLGGRAPIVPGVSNGIPGTVPNASIYVTNRGSYVVPGGVLSKGGVGGVNTIYGGSVLTPGTGGKLATNGVGGRAVIVAGGNTGTTPPGGTISPGTGGTISPGTGGTLKPGTIHNPSGKSVIVTGGNP